MPSGELCFYALGSGEYNELARASVPGVPRAPLASWACFWPRCRACRGMHRQTCCQGCQHDALAPHRAVSEILNSLIKVYKQIFRVNTLSDTVLFSKYPQTALVLDEVLKEASVWGGGRRRARRNVPDGFDPGRCPAFSQPLPTPRTAMQGIVQHLDSSSVARAMACKVRLGA